MKIIHGNPEFGSKLNKLQIDHFLTKNKLNLHLGTINIKNELSIHPVWFLYNSYKFHIETSKVSLKIKNIMKNSLVYFCIDSSTTPYLGVRGRGKAKLVYNIESNTIIAKKIIAKYVNPDSKIAKYILHGIKSGCFIVIEIIPQYFSTWNNAAL